MKGEPMNFTDIKQLTGIRRYENLTRFITVLHDVIVGYSNKPYLLNQWYNPGPAIVGRSTQEEIEAVLIKLQDEFGIDLSGMNFSKGLLFIKHFLLINREFKTEEMINYKKVLA